MLDLGPEGGEVEIGAVFGVVAANAAIGRNGAKGERSRSALLAGLNGFDVLGPAPMATLALHAGQARRRLEVDEAGPRAITDRMAAQALRVVLRAFLDQCLVG